MANEQNLRKTTPEQAREMGKKGGQAKSLAKKLINRKYCNSRCPLFVNCWAKHVSYTLYEKVVAKAVKKKWPEKEINKIQVECALKKLPTSVIEGAKRIILDGEEGFNNEMMEQVMRLKSDLAKPDAPPRFRERYLHQLRETKKSIFGDKSRIETNKGELTAEDFAKAYEEHKADQKKIAEQKKKAKK